MPSLSSHMASHHRCEVKEDESISRCVKFGSAWGRTSHTNRQTLLLLLHCLGVAPERGGATDGDVDGAAPPRVCECVRVKVCARPRLCLSSLSVDSGAFSSTGPRYRCSKHQKARTSCRYIQLSARVSTLRLHVPTHGHTHTSTQHTTRIHRHTARSPIGRLRA